jgi:hypothetical protein
MNIGMNAEIMSKNTENTNENASVELEKSILNMLIIPQSKKSMYPSSKNLKIRLKNSICFSFKYTLIMNLCLSFRMNATTNAIAIGINITNIKNIAPRFYTVFMFSKPFSPNLSLSGSAESLK